MNEPLVGWQVLVLITVYTIFYHIALDILRWSRGKR